MFLDVHRRRNPAFLEAVVALHRESALPAGCYAIDLDAVEANARLLAGEGSRLGLDVFAMTKQVGRNPALMSALLRGGIEAGVAVDLPCARALHACGLRVGHLGHLVQIPGAEADTAAALAPDWWTVFSLDKAREAARASAARGRDQALLMRVVGEGDTFYRGHEGGTPLAELEATRAAIDALDGAHVGGVTTFPALLFDQQLRAVVPTPNLRTLERARALLGDGIAVNAPGTTSSTVFGLLADAGVTQVEPGHALTGTTPLHAVRDLPELPAVLYVSEVSHRHGGQAFCFGGGLYVDPVFPPYPVSALVAREPDLSMMREVPIEIPPPEAIDYYGILDDATASTGDTVVCGFRIQAFVTRAPVAGVRGVSTGSPVVEGVWASDGSATSWP